MRTPDNKYTWVIGEILEVIPLKRFSHNFRFTNLDDPECTVTYDLEPAEGGVTFTLTIEKLPTGTKTAKQMVQSGTMIANTLRSVLEHWQTELRHSHAVPAVQTDATAIAQTLPDRELAIDGRERLRSRRRRHTHLLAPTFTTDSPMPTPEEMEATMVANLKEKTGNTMPQWLKINKASKNAELKKWLKEAYSRA
ncbi:MAG: hypothetical protein ACI841_000844 [Planctomycetota bacterium]|jgi:hypothetical protein